MARENSLRIFFLKMMPCPFRQSLPINFDLTFISSGDVVAVFIKGTAHCANMYPSSEFLYFFRRCGSSIYKGNSSLREHVPIK